MTFAVDLKIIRRFLRDPDGNIWSDDYLRHAWNDIQRDLQVKTSVLEDIAAQRIPDLYHMSYQHDWEWRYLPSSRTEFYQCLRKFDGRVFCHSWEPQHLSGIDPDTTDLGAHFTQPWEAFVLTPGEEVRLKFPRNFSAVKFIAYDEEPILPTTRKMVQSSDPSHVSREGRPIAYYPHESVDKSYVLYPRPSTSHTDDISGEGIAFYVSGDSEDDEFGSVALRTGSNEAGSGVSMDIIGTADSVLMIYEVSPADLQNEDQESDFPQFLRKYIRYGVLGRAYHANTDGRIPSLARLWESRYEMGINLVKRYVRSRANDRDYRLMTKGGSVGRRSRHPRLPDTYPNVGP